MLRFRLAFLGVLVVLAVSAVAGVSSAAAVEFELTQTKCGTTGITTFCWLSGEELLELKGEQPYSVALEGAESLLLATVGSTVVHIVCTGVGVGTTGVLRQPSPLTATPTALQVITFSGCSLLAPLSETCAVNPEIKTEDTTALFPSPEELTFEPAEGEIFVEIPFKNVAGKTCLLLGNQEVGGKAACLWSTPSEDLTTQLFVCKHSEGSLLFALVAATLEAEVTVKPNSTFRDSWEVVIGL